MATAYQYERLTHDDEIRLLHLESGSGDDVHFALYPVRLGDNPPYEAISYCWGDPSDTQMVYCDGKPLHITKSLYTGLKRLRKENAVRVLWADAVCIDQKNTLEKNVQVGLMSRIYSQPSCILIWLGDNTSGLEGLHECIQGALGVLPPEHFEFEKVYPISTRIFREANELRAAGKPNFVDHDWRPMTNLVHRPWFDRRWIIQEVTLADDSVPRLAICGHFEFSWNDLAAVAYRLASYGITPLLAGMSTINSRAPYMLSFLAEGGRPILILVALCMTYLLKTYRKTGNLVDSVISTSLFKCGFPHDHLYSLLSLPQKPSGVVADYRLSIEEVCMQFAETTLISDQNTRLLSLAPHTTIESEHRDGQRLVLPSWVPDLTWQGAVNPLVSYTIRPQLFHAGGKEPPNITMSSDRKRLRLRGRVVDKVATMARAQVDVPWPTEEEVRPKIGFHALVKKRLVNWLQECYEVAGEGYARRKTGQGEVATEESTEEAGLRRSFLETLLCGMTMMRDPIPEEALMATQVYVDYLFACFTDDFVLSEEVRETLLTYGPLIEQSLLGMAEARCFCRTEQGRLGQIRADAKAGDLFVCIVGAEVPYVLRPRPGKEGVYTLIGDGFLQGAMQGETWSDAQYETIDITIE
ncbi:heterokaryon incompatibility protein-domain-containing protein [Chaetomium fimeti]|uniref:Heterokaryon incompatibility protein-domain-containing protein n=1 Tax=Chaetomium fimeti TaxID=1854472 RepID=A0AAE0LTN8_9PEZI|nr:heterokaryon incompatibility protein-domain-containing protein [Chaetomium fimeti]